MRKIPKKMDEDMIPVISDKKECTVLNSSTESISRGTIDCTIHVPEIFQTFSLESEWLIVLRDFKTYLENISAKRHANNRGNHRCGLRRVFDKWIARTSVYGLVSNGSFLLWF